QIFHTVKHFAVEICCTLEKLAAQRPEPAGSTFVLRGHRHRPTHRIIDGRRHLLDNVGDGTLRLVVGILCDLSGVEAEWLEPRIVFVGHGKSPSSQIALTLSGGLRLGPRLLITLAPLNRWLLPYG